MGLDNNEPVASSEEVAILRRIRAQREGKHVLDPDPRMRSRTEAEEAEEPHAGYDCGGTCVIHSRTGLKL